MNHNSWFSCNKKSIRLKIQQWKYKNMHWYLKHHKEKQCADSFEWYLFECDNNLSFEAEQKSHSEHLKDFSFKWTALICIFKLPFVVEQ